MIRPTGASHAPERFSALRPPLDSGSVKQSCKPRTQICVAGTMEAVCMVSSAVGDARPHPEERACSVVLQSRTSVRASRRMRTATAWALMLRDASQRSRAGEASVLASRCDAPQHEGAATHHSSVSAASREAPPAAVRNDRRRNSIVSGLLFTMNGATATCRAPQRPSRIQVAARLPTRSSSPINPANTGSTPMPRTTLASRVRSPSQSSPW